MRERERERERVNVEGVREGVNECATNSEATRERETTSERDIE